MTNDPLPAELHALLGPAGVLTDPADLARYETGWRYGKGKARCVARPTTTDEVVAVLACCRRHGARVVAQGGNTGLVAASTPDASGTMVVLATERLYPTVEVDALGRTAQVGAGVLLSALQQELLPHGLWFPIDLGADPRLGGMLATNTGGTRLCRHGDVRRNVLGLEVVCGDGTVIRELTALRKNNTGLDGKQVFLGTSGAFGIITRAVLQLASLPAQRAVALIGCRDGEQVLALLQALERAGGELLSAFEVMSRNALRPALVHNERLRAPFGDALPAYAVLVELATALDRQRLDLDELLAAVLADCAHGDDAYLGAPEAFWPLRHGISEGLREEGRGLAFDLSVARSRLPALTAAVQAALAAEWPFARLCDYGHWADGGTHLVVTWRDADAPGEPEAIVAAMQQRIYDLAVRGFAGSYSAEHGVGPHNQRCYDRYVNPAVRALAAACKRHCDPEGVLGTVRLG